MPAAQLMAGAMINPSRTESTSFSSCLPSLLLETDHFLGPSMNFGWLTYEITTAAAFRRPRWSRLRHRLLYALERTFRQEPLSDNVLRLTHDHVNRVRRGLRCSRALRESADNCTT